MPRKLTKNASESAVHRVNNRLRERFRLTLRYMSLFDKTLLAEILDRHSDSALLDNAALELRLASAFETTIAKRYQNLLVVDAEEYERLLIRLEEAEAFRRKVTIMPARDVPDARRKQATNTAPRK
jgi:hypothetical protein